MEGEEEKELLSVGDTVILRSGGPFMTVQAVGKTGENECNVIVHCQYQVNGILISEQFKSITLYKVRMVPCRSS